MKTKLPLLMQPRKLAQLFTITTATFMLAACASQVQTPGGAVLVRNRLIALQANNELASRAPIEIQNANLAVTAAEQPQKDPVLAQHLLLIADKKVDIATAWAQSRLYEDQRDELSAQSEAARLQSRTREADLARSAATSARNDASVAQAATTAAQGETAGARNDANAARADAATARNQTALARLDTENASALNEDLQRQLDELNAKTTDRGLVITLGDVLFETGKAELRGGTTADLDRLAAFLNRYDTRTVLIEGHTDNVGAESFNLNLSQLRAGNVQAYLVNHGVAGSRISSAGRGEGTPIASNDGATGRQQNRRVEVIISDEAQ